MVGGIIEVHSALFFVVSGDLEGDDLELWDTRGHGEDLKQANLQRVLMTIKYPSAVRVIIDVFLSVWVSHTSGISSDNVELGASDQSSLGVPLDL